MLDFEEHQLAELKKFTKSAFSLDDILATASTLKYAGAVKRILERELENPSETFVRFFAAPVYDGRITQNVLEQFTGIVAEARAQFISEQVNERLKSALSAGEAKEREPREESEPVQVRESGSVETTGDEVEGYNIVKAICREVVNVKRIALRDTKSYCGILLDDNNRKPICRLRFNASKKYIGLMTSKVEDRIPMSELDDIFTHADKIKATELHNVLINHFAHGQFPGGLYGILRPRSPMPSPVGAPDRDRGDSSTPESWWIKIRLQSRERGKVLIYSTPAESRLGET